MKRKDLGREPSLSRSTFQRPWLSGHENKTNLYIGYEFGTWIAGVPCHPTQWKTASVMNIQPPQKKSMVWKGKHETEAFVQGTVANLNSTAAKTITSASWKLGDNLFILCCLSNLILLPLVDSLISKTQVCWAFASLFPLLYSVKLMRGAHTNTRDWSQRTPSHRTWTRAHQAFV